MTPILLQETSQAGGSFENSLIRYESSPSILKANKDDSIEELCVMVEENPPVLLTLFELSLYERLLGDENKLNQDLYLEVAEFKCMKGAIPALFKKTVASRVQLTGHQRSVYQVTVQGISRCGCKLIEHMQKEKRVPYELQKLYCGFCQPDRLSKPGLYSMRIRSPGNKFEASPFYQSILNSRDVSSMDVSCFTLRQCCEDEMLLFLLSRHASVYLHIDIYPGSDTRVKRVLWKSDM